MTKTVRIENACTSNYKVKITVQEKVVNAAGEWFGDWKDIEPHRPGEFELNYPTQLYTGYITSTRRIVIEENGSN